MAVAQGYGKTVTSGSVFAYDTGDTRNSYRGEPTTNVFTHYGTEGQGSGADNGVTFSINGTGTFVRLGYGQTFGDYTIKPGDVVYKYDLGAYGCHYHGNAPSIPSGKYLTFTFDYYVSPGTTIDNTTLAALENYAGSALSAVITAPNTLTGVWQTVSVTVGPTGGSGTQGMFLYPGYCGPRFGDTGYILYKNPQVEYLPHKTPFVQTTRSATQGLLPLVGNSTLNLSNVSFDSNAQMIFDGTNDYIDAPYYSPVSNALSRTWEVVVKPTTPMSFAGIFGQKIGYGCSYYCNGGIYLWDSNWVFNWFDNSSYQFLYTGVSPTPNQYFHIVATFDASDRIPRIYVNGQLQATWGGVTNMNYGDSTNIIDIGWNSKDGGQHYFGGELPVARHYSGKALTAAEVKQNFDFYDARFGIDVDTYYFVVSNRFSRSKWYSNGYTKVIADSTPAYIIYQKPDASNTSRVNYTEVARDSIGSPAKYNVFGNQYAYGSGRFFTSVTVRKSKVGGRLSFEFPDGRTSTYGEEFYKTIITPHVP